MRLPAVGAGGLGDQVPGCVKGHLVPGLRRVIVEAEQGILGGADGGVAVPVPVLGGPVPVPAADPTVRVV